MSDRAEIARRCKRSAKLMYRDCRGCNGFSVFVVNRYALENGYETTRAGVFRNEERVGECAGS